MSVRWPQVPNPPSFPDIEREVLEHWRRHDVFGASIALRADAPVWVFYEGPPTANGRPGTHHVESRTFKDVFPRYRTMKGFRVPRKGGWDCHGLPVELEVERELGLRSKADIERFGIAEFNRRCRESVMRYVDAWEELTERIGFWLDLRDAYRTMDPEYIDSLWWALHELWQRGLVYEDVRVTPYCPRCGTPLSDAEVALGYRTTTDPSVYVRFPLREGPLAGVSLLIWTTTPWTLHGNNAVAINPHVTYELVRARGTLVVIAADRREAVLGPDAEVVRTVDPEELVGVHYDAPFDWVPYEGDARYVVAADFVTTSEGTGLVHSASAFGAEDMELGRAHGLPVISAVGPDGRFTAGPFAGRGVKEADPDIIAALDAAGLLWAAETYEHTYPFCWRCDTPLIYYTVPSFYIRTTAVRDRMLEINATIDWHPAHIRDGRFGNWLANNVDWALSRNRYWGTPLPFWRCQRCGYLTVVSSRAHLGELAGRDLSDLDPHRPDVDEIELRCPECGGTQRRVPDVADAWFDSGAMPFAQWGYPYRGREQFEAHFPADFIAEAIDQTRGWFYTLLAEATLLFDSTAYRTCLCLGHIVDAEGRKMSKSLGNVIDPWELIDRHGADPLRWLMLAEGNPWANRRVSHDILDGIVRRFFMTLWNVHHFFLTYAALDGFDPHVPAPDVPLRPVMDRWVLSELADTVATVDASMERFDVTTACRRIETFVDDLSNWYVRRTRRRFWRAADADPDDKRAAHHTLHTCLVTLAGLLAPMTPFLADRLWSDLVRSYDPDAPVSVHLTDYPTPGWCDEELRVAMADARRLVELGRSARTEAGIRTRQPLPRALVSAPRPDRLRPLLDEIADELNVKQVELVTDTGAVVERQLRPNFRVLGPTFGADTQDVAAAIRALSGSAADRVAAELEQSGSAVVERGGHRWRISPEMVEVIEVPRTGWQVARDGAYAVALDLTIDDALRLEGAAREVIRAVNEHRKALDLPLDARIVLTVTAEPPDLIGQLRAAGWLEVIAAETLATEVRVAEELAEGVTVTLPGQQLRFSVEPTTTP